MYDSFKPLLEKNNCGITYVDHLFKLKTVFFKLLDTKNVFFKYIFTPNHYVQILIFGFLYALCYYVTPVLL